MLAEPKTITEELDRNRSMPLNRLPRPGETHPSPRTALAIHDDVGLMFALAYSLNERGISLLPARTVAEAIELLAAFSVTPEILLINCRTRSGLPFARSLLARTPNIKIIGFVSEPHRCDGYKELLSATVQPFEFSITKCVQIIVSLANEEAKLSLIE